MKKFTGLSGMVFRKKKCSKLARGCTLRTINMYISHNIHFVFVACLALLVISGTVFANPETLWNTISGLIGTWVTRLGAVVMFVGGIMFGLGWKNDDAEQKSRGISTLIAGAIVTAVAALTGTFFA